MKKYLENHWVVEKGVLRYLQGSINFGIKYIDFFQVKLIGYSDSDWVGDLEDKISIKLCSFNMSSRFISRSSKDQSIVSLS